MGCSGERFIYYHTSLTRGRGVISSGGAIQPSSLKKPVNPGGERLYTMKCIALEQPRAALATQA